MQGPHPVAPPLVALTKRAMGGMRSVGGRLACLFGIVAALGACAVGPDFTRPEAPVPGSWQNAGDPRVSTQAAADSRWWKAFEDTSLDRLVELAYHQNLPLQVAGLRIVEARAQLGIASGMQYPQMQVAFGNANAVGLSENIAKIGGLPRNYFGYQVGLDAAWELDFWGKYKRGVQAEAAEMLATIADYYSAIVSLSAEIARTYVMIRTFEVLIDQANENVALQEKALEIAESRFRNGATSELDPTQAATLLESTRATIPRRQTALQQARNALSTLLGQSPDTIEPLLVGPKAIPKAPVTVAIDVPAAILRRRPDIRSAELYAAAQCARIGVAKADLYPSFSLAGTIGLDASTRGTASANLFSSGSMFYLAGPRINWAFLNYGRITNAVRVQDARFQQLLVGYRNTVLKAAQEVDDALVGFLNAQAAAAFEQNAVTSAQRSVELAISGYREGAVDYQRVLDAQRSLLQQQNDLTESSSSIATSLIALYKALGGGWELRQNDPVVPERTQNEMKERTDWDDMLGPSRPQEPKKNAAPAKH
ncbi:RND efflux system, outer membrane lipoprotein CmeC [Labilithrix luteola]|uniref:RND efflux system, outer membrane lipoprotein CmeC n=1 Tax=Labilithrix luteola TaxID=1391654 RepID=A0A0K1PST4_9BACT|nr:efflux transporter outer membrane subunit [Labilithrix luteola]AKU96577.1 RND efflux system, outer membrane lipoprotein CmeC [Labilithrix luteola]